MMTESGSPPTAEELAGLQEQLAESRAEVERLQRDATDAEARTTAAVAEAAGLRNQLEAAQTSQGSAEVDAQSAREYVQAAEERLRAAAAKYRELVVRTEPELPADLIAGDDVEAVDASATAARGVGGGGGGGGSLGADAGAEDSCRTRAPGVVGDRGQGTGDRGQG